MIAAVVGELQAGVGTVHLLERGVRTDAAIVTEPYGARNVTTVHAGRWQAAITAYGRGVHHSRREQGVDAIAAMLDVIREVNRMPLSGGPWAKVPGVPRLGNVGSLIGGHGPDHEIAGAYYVADICSAIVDIRHGPGQHRRVDDREPDGDDRRPSPPTQGSGTRSSPRRRRTSAMVAISFPSSIFQRISRSSGWWSATSRR